MTVDTFDRLSKPVEHFLLLGKPVDTTLARMPPPVTARTETTLKQLVQMFNDNAIHRIYVVDDHFRPIGVVTLTDVLQVMVQ